MGKNKHFRFAENLTFSHLFQPRFDEVFQHDFYLKGRWNTDFFRNQNPIILELGCGYGEYTVELARRFNNFNFIGVDIKGARLWVGAKQVATENLKNVAFLRTRIEFIRSFFALGEVSEIWFTFPDPQAKKSRIKKRLTSPQFLNLYKTFLKDNAVLHLKTDSDILYQYTLHVLHYNNLPVLVDNCDVYSAEPDALLSIHTRYEKMFLHEGKKIKYIRWLLPNNCEIKSSGDEKLFSASV